jgi:hypothetical protein
LIPSGAGAYMFAFLITVIKIYCLFCVMLHFGAQYSLWTCFSYTIIKAFSAINMVAS